MSTKRIARRCPDSTPADLDARVAAAVGNVFLFSRAVAAIQETLAGSGIPEEYAAHFRAEFLDALAAEFGAAD